MFVRNAITPSNPVCYFTAKSGELHAVSVNSTTKSITAESKTAASNVGEERRYFLDRVVLTSKPEFAQ